MSTAVLTESKIRRVDVSDTVITAHLADGRAISVPLAWSWRLSDASAAQRANWTIIGHGSGIHWPDIDEDISLHGMLTGTLANRPVSKSRRAASAPKTRLSSRTGRKK